MSIFRIAVLFATCFACILPASAHQVDSVELEFHSKEDVWQFKGLLDIAYMLPESRGIDDAPPLYRNEVMAASDQEKKRYIAEAERTMRNLLVVKFNDQPLDWSIHFPEFETEPLVLPQETGGWALMTAEISIKPRPGPGELKVFWMDDLSSELIVILLEEDGIKDLLSVSRGMSRTLLQVSAPEESGESVATAPSKMANAESWVISGFRHVIPLGLDHILFILGLFLLAPRWKPLLSQSLLFTLAHSITLALAVLGVISLPSQWIEVLIAASIAWIGIENLIVKELKPRRMFLVLGFGLLHGLGFASVLREKLGDLSGSEVTFPLVSFNIGVELAQIALLVCAFIILMPLRKWTKTVQTIGSLAVALAGLFWVYDRLPI